MLAEVVEPKRDHGWAPSIKKVGDRRPPQEATPTWRRLRPPERLFDFEKDVSPRQADIVQVALGQFA
jgi:hypothetical protein